MLNKTAVISIVVLSIFAGRVGHAGCNPCGCNPAGTPLAWEEIQVYGWPTTATVGLCCDSTAPLTALEVLSMIGANISSSDRDYYDQFVWGVDDYCHCYLIYTYQLPSDSTDVTWSGTIDRCTPGIQHLTATFFNPTVTDAPIGGAVCTAYEGNICICSVACQTTVPITVQETRTLDLPVEVVPTVCSSCRPDLARFTCNTYQPPPDGFLFPPDGGPRFHNQHLFDFTLKGYAYGTGHTATERLQVKTVSRIYSGSAYGHNLLYESPIAYSTDSSGTSWTSQPCYYEKSEFLVCSQSSCEGFDRVTMGDTYAFTPDLFSDQQYLNAYNRTHYVVFETVYADTWNDQTIWIDRGMDTEKQVGGAFTSTVNIKENVGIESNMVNRVYSGTKAGNI